MSRSLAVQEYMSAALVSFSPDMDVMDAISTLVERRISGAPVVDRMGNLVGVLSEKDCMHVTIHACYHEEFGGPVSEYMSSNVVTVEADTSILEVAKMFQGGGFRRYPVMKDNRLVGQISRRDVLRALLTGC